MVYKIVKHLKEAHRRADDHELSLDEINEECSFANSITEQTRNYLEYDALPKHSKIDIVMKTDEKTKMQIQKYKFKPPFDFKTREGLDKKLKEYHEYQLGAISVEDVEECMEKAGRAIEKLKSKNKVYVITSAGQKKKELLFHKDRKIEAQFDDTMKRYWREASIEGMTDEKIVQFLRSKGHKGIVQNSAHKFEPKDKKRKKTNTGEGKRRKKELNKHVEGLKDYTQKQLVINYFV